MQVQFARHSYQARALELSAQRLVNLYAERAPRDAKDTVALFGGPGIKAFASSVGSGPIRGTRVMAGVLYTVSGDTLYSVDSAGTATSLGQIYTSSGRVGMSHNQASPPQLIIVDGAHGWIYTTSGGLTQITDTDFFASSIVDFQDQYFILLRDGTGQFFLSDTNDGTAYGATDIANAEGAPDDLVSLIVNHRELWLLGEDSTEVWYNQGGSDFPFARFEGAFVERGCAAARSVAEDDNTIFWLGEDKIIYRAAGYTPERISTHAIEEAIRGYATISDAEAFIYTLGGHKVYVLTFPNEKATFAYDIATQLWHERESFGLGRWRACCHVRAYGKQLVGDAFEGKIGELDLDTYDEYGSTMQAIATGPHVYSDKHRIFHRRFELDMAAGVGLTTGQGSDPQIWLDWSQDGGHTWSDRKPPRSIGAIGKRTTRVRWIGLGASRDRVYRVTMADPVKRAIVAASLDAEKGLH